MTGQVFTSVVTLERLRWFDLDEVMAIEDDLFGPERWTPAMFWNELANGHHYVVAREPGGAIVGYAGIAVVKPEAWVNNIAVRRDRQRSGIGRLLLIYSARQEPEYVYAIVIFVLAEALLLLEIARFIERTSAPWNG